MTGRLRRALAVVVTGVALLSALTACGSGSDSGDTIRFALDWTPNTNHSGLYVALQRGYFAEAGLDVQVLPYNNTSVGTVIDAGNAEFGISTHNSATFARAAGARTKSVLAPLQHWATGIGVRADRADIASPKDLDGKTYAGFGDPGEKEALQQVIRNDGGTGDFTSVTLGSSAYEAVYSGKADFTVSYLAWEGIEAEHHGTPMKYFRYTDFGFPDAYAIVIDANEDWLAANPERARQFVQALQRGYQFAADNPDAAAQDLIDANPGAFNDEKLVFESQRMLAEQFMKDADGRVGTQTQAQWAANSGFLYRGGLLNGPDGSPLTAEPDWSTYFTNEYLGNP
ncbi:ABC transporter substrate-binding protein [Nocardia puris]|uniref:Thiamine pyrimidine synthase n=1 Tax=Nocardia puris TaxID=208602 RepID=A0A366E3L1_9NOCA|nr:ABC transporter substrate-binding protein [Nocardia puris]MBF6209741.1 ABC transporter substrate-binding protein [Nocardia puris]MBF6366313.1 ABC transporter substrate-binding protein [Nocardia puris]MBF6458348.1 ABC transporter substrate-binding protein [Nocardia puris]RBO95998.1 ABC-type nitrate/sulfonate/bicarbonate transport system substrate-binding protein [Nocardia puris]